jgi:uncharacterized OB-fold protein
MNRSTDELTRLFEVTTLLLAIGYPATSRLSYSAARLAGAPAVLADLREYLRQGRPTVDGKAPIPACLLRPLAHDLTLAALMSEALLAPSGAFLLAAEMEQDPARANALLARLIADGVWTVGADGTRSLRQVPLAGRYPRCPRCGRPQLNPDAACVRCADLQLPSLSPTQRELAQMLDWLDAAAATAVPVAATLEEAGPVCPRCGASNRPQAQYCAHCGEARETARHCRVCGATIHPRARFCGGCGSAVPSS